MIAGKKYKASIDVGSNTILLLIGEYTDRWVKQKTYSHITGLGKKIDISKRFSEESMALSFIAFKDYFEILEKLEIAPSEVLVTATEASRFVQNSSEFFRKIESSFGFITNLISSEGEAFYTSLGVWSGLDLRNLNLERVYLIDIGGASTELINIRVKPKFDYIESLSLPLGSVRATDWLAKNLFEENVNAIFSSNEIERYKTDHIICVAGSMTAIGGMLKNLVAYSDDAVNGIRFNFQDLSTLSEKVEYLKLPQLLSKFPFLAKRSETIRGGIRVGLECGRRLGVKNFEVSIFGLRHGTLFANSLEEKYVIRKCE